MSGHSAPNPRWSVASRVVTFLVGTGLAVLASLSSPGLQHGMLINADTAMRLLRLRDSLAAGLPLHTIMRDSSGQGPVLHWSHLLDAVILLVAAPTAAISGWNAGLQSAALILGPLTIGLLALSIAWAILPIAQSGTRLGQPSLGPVWMVALPIGLAPSIVQYGVAAVVHHHVLLAASGAWVAGWAIRAIQGGGARAGLGVGFSAAIGLWLSPEALTLGLMAIGGVWVAWVARPNLPLARSVGSAGLGLLGATVGAWLIDPPATGYGAAEPDRLSLMFVWLAIGAAFASCLALTPRSPRVIALAGGLVAASAWLIAYPQILRGTSGLMTPMEASVFFDGILEMEPVASLATAVVYLGSGAMAVLFIGWAAYHKRSTVILYAAACALVLVVLGARHVRFASYPATLAAALLPVAIATVMRSSLSNQGVALARIGIIGVVLAVPPIAGYALAAMDPASVPSDPSGLTTASCSLDEAAGLVEPLGAAVVLAPVNEGPFLLWRSQIRTVGTLYHRGIDGFMRLHTAWFDPADPRGAVKATGADYVLFCPQPGLAGPAGSLLTQLNKHQPPPWLIYAGAGGGYVLYRVMP